MKILTKRKQREFGERFALLVAKLFDVACTREVDVDEVMTLMVNVLGDLGTPCLSAHIKAFDRLTSGGADLVSDIIKRGRAEG